MSSSNQDKEKSNRSRAVSREGSSMSNSVLRFDDVSFLVGKGENERAILEDVSGKVKYGHVLAIMGPR